MQGKWRRRVGADMERWNFNIEVWEPVPLVQEFEGPRKWEKRTCQDWVVGYMVHLRDLWIFGPDLEEEDDWEQRVEETKRRALRAQQREKGRKTLHVKLEEWKAKRKEMEMKVSHLEQRPFLLDRGEESCDEDFDFC